MKNKIQTTIIILAIFAMGNLMATSQSQLYDRDSFVVTSVNSLARTSGIIGIYDSYPTTGANVMRTFSNILIERNYQK